MTRAVNDPLADLLADIDDALVGAPTPAQAITDEAEVLASYSATRDERHTYASTEEEIDTLREQLAAAERDRAVFLGWIVRHHTANRFRRAPWRRREGENQTRAWFAAFAAEPDAGHVTEERDGLLQLGIGEV